MEDSLGVKIDLRSDAVHVEGPEESVARVQRIFQDFEALRRQGVNLHNGELNGMLRLVVADPSASLRSLVALQASGLAASMHANRNYWAAGAAPVPLTVTGLTIGDATLQGDTTDCKKGSGATPCLPATLAAFDLHRYALALNSMMPGSNPITTITCPALPLPISCTIQVTWGEHAVSINKESAAATVQSKSATPGTFAPTYTLYVEP